MKIKKKTPYQLEELNKLYLEEKYPSQLAMDDYATCLGLTCKQVRDWFVEKRRREKRENRTLLPLCSISPKKPSNFNGGNVLGVSAAKHIQKRLPVQEACTQSFSRYAMARFRDVKKSHIKSHFQGLLTPEYILKKVFRKDGPPLGMEFDKIPSRELCSLTDAKNSTPSCQEDQGPSKRRKVPMQALINDNGSVRQSPMKSHGLGKGLMTVWRVTNPNARDFPSISFADKEISGLGIASNSSSTKSSRSRKRAQKPVPRNGRPGNRIKDKRKLFFERVVLSKNVNKKHFPKEKCKLTLEKEMFLEQLNRAALLIDDEELELEELQGGSYSQMHCDHLSASREHGCSLCKDVLAKFPPNSVKMKKPISMQPWDSSPEIVKKLFKVFHFLYTYATVIDICPFTLDEFVQAFHDKDSMLLGKIHVTLISLLLHDVEVEMNNGNFAYLNKSCNFLALIQSLENNEYSLDFWRRYLNSLTWIEILRQVLGAAGFGYKHGTMRREACSKDMDLLVKYGLHPGTLKCTLFKILSEQGNNGSKVSDLAKSMQVVELNLASSTEEVEDLICSTLSSDISLFEKISASAYRLRMSVVSRDDSLSDTEDAGSVDDGLNECSTDDECAFNSEGSHSKISKPIKHWRSKNNMLTLQTEIDESHPGEVWLLGLMEGEYSSLSIEEKLNALVALTDLLSTGSSIREKDPSKTLTDCSSGTRYCGSGAKIKKSLLKQPSLPGSFKSLIEHIYGVKEAYPSLTSCPYPVDSSLLVSDINADLQSSSNELQEKAAGSLDAHPIQSVFLGSDRRYNRYWLFLGPCDVDDPGHRRIYFESSEDGHWEVIDTEEGLCTLLSVLDNRGKREALLIDSLGKRQEYLCQAMSRTLVNDARRVAPYKWPEVDLVTDDSYSPVSDVDNLSLSEIVKDSLPSAGAVVLGAGNKGEEQIKSWIRLQAFDSWIWSSFYLNLNVVKHGRRSYLDSFARCECCHDLYWRDEKHCRICHTTFELDFGLEERYAIHAATCKDKNGNTFPKHKVLSSQTQSLKAAIYAIESVMPEDALVGAWRKSAHKLWVRRLRRTSSLVELLQVLADFVGAINEDWLYRCNFPHHVVQEVIVSFTSMPHTSSALALWLVKLDTIIAPYLEKHVVNRG